MIHQPQFRNNFRDQFAIIETLTIETREIVRKQKLELQAEPLRFPSASQIARFPRTQPQSGEMFIVCVTRKPCQLRRSAMFPLRHRTFRSSEAETTI